MDLICGGNMAGPAQIVSCPLQTNNECSREYAANEVEGNIFLSTASFQAVEQEQGTADEAQPRSTIAV